MNRLIRFAVCAMFLVALSGSRFRCGSSSASASVPKVPYVKPVKPAKGITPNPLVSRGHAVVSNMNGSNPGKAVDGKYRDDAWAPGDKMTEEKPAYLSVDVGQGPTKLVLNWTSSFDFPFNDTTYGGFGAWRIETSADSEDGKDGTWKVAAETKGNTYRGREQAFDFTGQRWVRLAVTAKTAKTNQYGVKVDELDIHDTSAGSEDTWFFFGDSITAFSYDREAKHQPSFAELIHKKHPAYFPLMVNGGIGFEKSSDGLARLPALLKEFPDVHDWAICYGTNDAAGNSHPGPDYKSNLEEMVKLIQGAGRVPIFARVPFSTQDHDFINEYNDVVDAVTKAHGLTPGPDLYTYFKTNPAQLADGIHPNDAGIVAINRLWADAVDGLY
jgi:lysophospholipase L1-like esterase